MNQIIYHASCFDGFCSAWLCHKVWPNAEFIPANYGWKPPDVTNKNVLIVDFSYPRSILLELKEKAASLQVLDHHETAKDELQDLDFCTFDMKRSGAGLTWDYLAKHEPFPEWATARRHWLVEYVQDRDLWLKELPNSNAINACLRSYPLDFSVWDKLAQRTPQDFIIEGEAILRHQQQTINHHLKYLEKIKISDLIGKGCACSDPHIWSELMACAFERDPSLPFAVVWCDTINGERLYSIRTQKDGLHAGNLAKLLGGGGHPGSAGFKVNYSFTLDNKLISHLESKQNAIPTT